MVLELNRIAWPADREIPDLGDPLPNGTVVVSVDSHLIEPENLWLDYLPERYRDRAPRLWRDETGFHMECDGRSYDTPGLNSLLVEGRPGMWDQEARMRDLDAEGVDKELIFPQKTLALLNHADRDFLLEIVRAYNRYLADYCRAYPTRLYGVAILPWWDPEAVADHLQEIKALGFKALEMPSSPRDIYYNSRSMEPMWTAIEESGIPLSFHIGENFFSKGLGGLGVTLMVNFQPFRRLWATFTFSGILERHPGLRLVFTEGGIGWVPTALFDADRTYRDFESEMNPKLAHPPSYYWFQNCYATFQEDPHGLMNLEHIGWDHVLWASDYPHPESTVGYTRRSVWDVFEATDVEKAQAIVGGTAVKLWGLD